jgi:hypothetical protein
VGDDARPGSPCVDVDVEGRGNSVAGARGGGVRTGGVFVSEMESAWKNLVSGCDLPTDEGGPRDTVEPGGDGASRFRGPSAWRPLA